MRLAAERHRLIVRHLRARGVDSVENLALALGASVSTVRRDLDVLQREGLVRRVHGGATLGDGTAFAAPDVPRAVDQLAEKRRIAARAAALVPPGATVLIAGGSTTALLVSHLHDVPGLSVVTNSVAVAHALATTSAVPVIVLGGYLRHPEMSLLGQAVVDGLAHLRVDVALCSVHGLDPVVGTMGTDPAEADTDRHMVAAAPTLIVLADHTKFTRRSAVRVVPTERIATLVTDDAAPAGTLDEFRARGVDVVVA